MNLFKIMFCILGVNTLLSSSVNAGLLDCFGCCDEDPSERRPLVRPPSGEVTAIQGLLDLTYLTKVLLCLARTRTVIQELGDIIISFASQQTDANAALLRQKGEEYGSMLTVCRTSLAEAKACLPQEDSLNELESSLQQVSRAYEQMGSVFSMLPPAPTDLNENIQPASPQHLQAFNQVMSQMKGVTQNILRHFSQALTTLEVCNRTSSELQAADGVNAIYQVLATNLAEECIRAGGLITQADTLFPGRNPFESKRAYFQSLAQYINTLRQGVAVRSPVWGRMRNIPPGPARAQ